MTIEIQDMQIRSGSHVVEFYERDSELARTVGAYLLGALRAGGTAIMIATEAHRCAFDAELRAAGIDPATRRRDGSLVALDAAETLASFMSPGRLDSDAFRDVVGSVVRRGEERGRPVRAFGEMVSLLWEAGDVLAAIDLEKLWNELGREIEFSLLCAYRGECVDGDDNGRALEQVCQLHSAVHHPPGGPDPLMRPQAGTEFSRVLAAERDAPRAARHFIADRLGRWGHAGEFVDDARLVVTELATNAVLHARSPFSVGVRVEEAGVRISVRDVSPVEPRPRQEWAVAASGRGLRLVAALSDDWGVEVDRDGKTVWARLSA